MKKLRKPDHISQEAWDAVDSPPVPAAMIRRMKPARRRARKGAPKKVPVQIRLEPEIVSYFKSLGGGWQTRINRVLFDHVRRLQD